MQKRIRELDVREKSKGKEVKVGSINCGLTGKVSME